MHFKAYKMPEKAVQWFLIQTEVIWCQKSERKKRYDRGNGISWELQLKSWETDCKIMRLPMKEEVFFI